MAMVRFGQLGKLKKEKIDEYVELADLTAAEDGYVRIMRAVSE